MKRVDLSGTMSSLRMNFSRSANGCSIPPGPTRFGPSRPWMSPSTRRSANTVYATIRSTTVNATVIATNLRPMSISVCKSIFDDCEMRNSKCEFRNPKSEIRNSLPGDLVERRDRRRLGPRVAGRQQMKLRHLVREISYPKQFVSDLRSPVNLLARIVERFNTVTNRGDGFRDVGLGHVVLDLDRIRLVFQQRIAHSGIRGHVLADGPEHRAGRKLITKVQPEFFRKLSDDHPVRFRLMHRRNRLSYSLDQAVIIRERA